MDTVFSKLIDIAYCDNKRVIKSTHKNIVNTETTDVNRIVDLNTLLNQEITADLSNNYISNDDNVIMETPVVETNVNSINDKNAQIMAHINSLNEKILELMNIIDIKDKENNDLLRDNKVIKTKLDTLLKKYRL